MGSHAKVENLSDGRTIKRNQAFRRVQQCVSVWVEEGRTIRNLTLRESIIQRSQIDAEPADFPLAELRSVIYRPAETSAPISRRARRELIQSAGWYCAAVHREQKAGEPMRIVPQRVTRVQ